EDVRVEERAEPRWHRQHDVMMLELRGEVGNPRVDLVRDVARPCAKLRVTVLEACEVEELVDEMRLRIGASGRAAKQTLQLLVAQAVPMLKHRSNEAHRRVKWRAKFMGDGSEEIQPML